VVICEANSQTVFKVLAYVRWGTTISKTFQLLCGVRQGDVLSPCLFALFIDSVIQKLRPKDLTNLLLDMIHE